MGIKEHTCHDKHQVIYGSVRSLKCIPETNSMLTGIKNLKKLKIKNRNSEYTSFSNAH